MSIAITLAAGFYLLVANMQQLTGDLESSNQMSLFLKYHVSEKEGIKLADKIRLQSNIENVTYISKKQALAEFKLHSGFGEALDVLENNPLPAVIQVLPKDSLNESASIEKLVHDFNNQHQVDFAQMDMQWVKRLQSMMQILQRGVFLLSLLLGVAVLFITGNTIRLELQNRRDEVLIAKLVGATHAFIQRPFLYTGFWLGLLSGIVAWLLIGLMVLVLESPIERLSGLYEGAFSVLYLSFSETLILLVIASVLGVLGALSVMSYQLQQIKPE